MIQIQHSNDFVSGFAMAETTMIMAFPRGWGIFQILPEEVYRWTRYSHKYDVT